MSSSQSATDPTPEKQQGTPLPPPPGAEEAKPASIFRGLSDIMHEGNEGDWKKKGIVVLRALALLFSFLSFIIMATNVRGYYINGFQANFSLYEEFAYVLSIAIFAMVYTAAQTWIKIRQLRTGKELMAPRSAALVDFICDQIIAWLLLSSASAASPSIVGLKWVSVDPFIDQLAASISMSYLAFFSLAPVALHSGFSLSIQLAKSWSNM